MIGGIDWRHAWTPPGGEAPVVTLNELRDAEGKEVWPRYPLRRITGLHSLGDPEDQRDPKVGAVGEIARLSQRRGRTLAYEGAIQARTLLELREAEQTLRSAFADLTREGRMDCSPHPSSTEFEEASPVFFEARPLTLEIVDDQTTKTWRRLFVLGLRQSDPRHFEEAAEIASATIEETNVAYPLA